MESDVFAVVLQDYRGVISFAGFFRVKAGQFHTAIFQERGGNFFRHRDLLRGKEPVVLPESEVTVAFLAEKAFPAFSDVASAAGTFADHFTPGGKQNFRAFDDLIGFLAAFTDMIDGWIARKLELKSSFGAKLDTVADFIFIAVVLVKVIPVIYMPGWLWIWAALIAVIKLTNLLSSFVMFHRLIPIHSVMNKITGFILFLLPFSIGRCSWQTFVITVIVACSIATFAAIQEGHFIRTGKEIE
jgi:CDP-diacylglycerol--glycerol-3-phosphate 3-phosphatidyltransferase